MIDNPETDDRVGLKKSFNPSEGSLAALQKINEAGAERVTAKVNMFKEFVDILKDFKIFFRYKKDDQG